MENTRSSRRNRMRKAITEAEVPKYPHVRVVHCTSGRLMIQISWGKNREVTIMGNRITMIVGAKTNNYGVYEGNLDTGSFETVPENIEIIK